MARPRAPALAALLLAAQAGALLLDAARGPAVKAAPPHKRTFAVKGKKGPRRTSGPRRVSHDRHFQEILALERERQQGVHGAGCELPPDEGLMRDEFNISRRWCRTAANFTMAVLGHDDAVSKNICGRGWWEFTKLKDIGGGMNVRPGQTFVDVGANIGWWTLMFANAGLRVHAFEAMPFNNALIKASLCRNPRLKELVTLHEAALGSERRSGAQCDIYSHPMNVGDGMLCCGSDSCIKNDERNHGWEYEKRGTVPLTTMDSLLEGEKLGRVVAMKVDVEGYECEVMKGGWKTVLKHKPKYLLSEVWFGKDGAGGERGCSGTEYLEMLERFGYIWHRNSFNPRPEYITAKEEVKRRPEIYTGIKNVYGLHDSAVGAGNRNSARQYRAPPPNRNLRMLRREGGRRTRNELMRELRGETGFTGRGIMIHVSAEAAAEDLEEQGEEYEATESEEEYLTEFEEGDA